MLQPSREFVLFLGPIGFSYLGLFRSHLLYWSSFEDFVCIRTVTGLVYFSFEYYTLFVAFVNRWFFKSLRYIGNYFFMLQPVLLLVRGDAVHNTVFDFMYSPFFLVSVTWRSHGFLEFLPTFFSYSRYSYSNLLRLSKCRWHTTFWVYSYGWLFFISKVVGLLFFDSLLVLSKSLFFFSRKFVSFMLFQFFYKRLFYGFVGRGKLGWLQFLNYSGFSVKTRVALSLLFVVTGCFFGYYSGFLVRFGLSLVFLRLYELSASYENSSLSVWSVMFPWQHWVYPCKSIACTSYFRKYSYALFLFYSLTRVKRLNAPAYKRLQLRRS